MKRVTAHRGYTAFVSRLAVICVSSLLNFQVSIHVHVQPNQGNAFYVLSGAFAHPIALLFKLPQQIPPVSLTD